MRLNRSLLITLALLLLQVGVPAHAQQPAVRPEPGLDARIVVITESNCFGGQPAIPWSSFARADYELAVVPRRPRGKA